MERRTVRKPPPARLRSPHSVRLTLRGSLRCSVASLPALLTSPGRDRAGGPFQSHPTALPHSHTPPHPPAVSAGDPSRPHGQRDRRSRAARFVAVLVHRQSSLWRTLTRSLRSLARTSHAFLARATAWPRVRAERREAKRPGEGQACGAVAVSCGWGETERGCVRRADVTEPRGVGHRRSRSPSAVSTGPLEPPPSEADSVTTMRSENSPSSVGGPCSTANPCL